ncbi:MAG TPA: 8-oxo-dGTP diphosphatase [Candidatus Saccharimonadales bacterium]|nr:8-oxo-dGTP diphosphatase [Candidatus Saccharimonadales bacterium]
MKLYTLMLLKRDGELLLAMKKRGFGAGRWNGVGGKVEKGETISEAAVRECDEEIGVQAEHFSLVAVHDFLFPEGEDMRVFVYTCDQWSGEPVETEEMRPQWFSLDAIPYSEMWQDDIIWLPFVLAGKCLKGSFTFDSDDNLCAGEVVMVDQIEEPL